MASMSATSFSPLATSLRTQRQAFGLPASNSRRTSNSQLISRPTVVRTPAQRVVKAQIAQEAFQVADIGGFISGTAATVFAMTLVGLAIGFVLLRFEALVEEGKIV